MSAYSLPVLMYHYVSRFPGAIAVSPEHFEDQCRGMAEHGWRGIGLDEAEGFLLKGAPLPPRSLLITFDDGYLDNYVYAWPILRKYGHKGVVFAVTERMVAEKNAARPLPTSGRGCLRPASLPWMRPCTTPPSAIRYAAICSFPGKKPDTWNPAASWPWPRTPPATSPFSPVRNGAR